MNWLNALIYFNDETDLLFFIKMENKIYNSLSTEIFVSPCDIYLEGYLFISLRYLSPKYMEGWLQIFTYLEPALHKKVLFGAGFEPAHCKHAIRSHNPSSHRIKQISIFLVHNIFIQSDIELIIKYFSVVEFF